MQPSHRKWTSLFISSKFFSIALATTYWISNFFCDCEQWKKISNSIYISSANTNNFKQESPADTDKPAQRESMPKSALIRRENKLQTCFK